MLSGNQLLAVPPVLAGAGALRQLDANPRLEVTEEDLDGTLLRLPHLRQLWLEGTGTAPEVVEHLRSSAPCTWRLPRANQFDSGCTAPVQGQLLGAPSCVCLAFTCIWPSCCPVLMISQCIDARHVLPHQEPAVQQAYACRQQRGGTAAAADPAACRWPAGRSLPGPHGGADIPDCRRGANMP